MIEVDVSTVAEVSSILCNNKEVLSVDEESVVNDAVCNLSKYLAGDNRGRELLNSYRGIATVYLKIKDTNVESALTLKHFSEVLIKCNDGLVFDK